MPQAPTLVKAPRRRLVLGAGRGRLAVAAVLLGAAFGYVVLEPWHGPAVLAFSEQHGIDAADLPAVVLIALATVLCHTRSREAGRVHRWWRSDGLVLALAIVLGAVLLAGILDPLTGSPLVPAGGGTFGGSTQHVDGRRAEPVGRWTHLAVTYDGATYRLYVDGIQTSSRQVSGPIRRTTDPLWIGGNRPYGEYFHGVVDEARVYDRALSPAEVRVAMSTPVGARGGALRVGLEAAYGFEAGDGRTVIDTSGNGNTGAIRGAVEPTAGRFGRGLKFDGQGAVVRIPESASLNLRTAMTLMAWIKPSKVQPRWRTVLARQTDAYFLAAGGGVEAGRLARFNRLRFALEILLLVAIGLLVAGGNAPWATKQRRWYWLVALFVAGSVIDVMFAPSTTLVGPALVAIWCGATSARRRERVSMYAIAATFAAVTILSIADPGALPVIESDGGARAAALGLVLAVASALTWRPAHIRAAGRQ